MREGDGGEQCCCFIVYTSSVSNNIYIIKLVQRLHRLHDSRGSNKFQSCTSQPILIEYVSVLSHIVSSP
jgi:hypothetical protein